MHTLPQILDAIRGIDPPDLNHAELDVFRFLFRARELHTKARQSIRSARWRLNNSSWHQSEMAMARANFSRARDFIRTARGTAHLTRWKAPDNDGTRGTCDDCGHKNGRQMPGGFFQCKPCFYAGADA
jgi:hypothetical protein